jgi:hypothetical protein
MATMSAPSPHPDPPTSLDGSIYGQETLGQSPSSSVVVTDPSSFPEGHGASSSTSVGSLGHLPWSITPATSFLPRRDTPTVPDAGSDPYPTQDFTADTQHHSLNSNNLTSTDYDLLPLLLENHHFITISVEADNQFRQFIEDSTTAADPLSYSSPISLPQLSVPVPSPKSEPVNSEQELFYIPPDFMANFTRGIWEAGQANSTMSSPTLTPPGNLQWIDYPQNPYQDEEQRPPSVPSLALSQTGIVRTARRTAQQHTPMSCRRDGDVPDRPNLTDDEYVVCQWNSCGQTFFTTGKFEKHCRRDHSISGSKPVKAECQWHGCPRGVKDSLLRHILCQHAKARFPCHRGCGKSMSRPYGKHKCASVTPAEEVLAVF